MSAVRNVIRPPGPKWFRRAVGVAGAVYLSAMFLNSAGSSLPRDHLPRPVLYFPQVACLFPSAALRSIDHRVAGYSCRDRRFHELDHREYFPIRPDDKENRFQRLVHFYRSNAPVMNALDEHLVERHNARVERGQDPGDGIEGPIGGILVVSLRVPLPEPGTRVDQAYRTPLMEAPREWRKPRYRTPKELRAQRCSAVAP
ncbi:MAG TPA: hypothetical protein VML75_22590 [Kofleriaceae bacterium]|nr:hypothetical protein [Kofleriaceae bacterium]